MKVKKILRTLIILTMLTFNFGCDQISKSIVRQRIDYNEKINLIMDYLILTKVENTGAFLSIGHSLPQPLRMLLLTILPIIVLCIALFYLLTKKSLSNLTILGICFVVGGGVGNIYDRLVYGSVTDFLQMNFVIVRTGIFNMADVSIMAGMFMILLAAYLKQTKFNYETVDKISEA